MGPIHLGSRMGTPQGIYPWRTGDGKFDGETFLGGLWMFFSWGGGGGEEELQVTTVEVFSQDDTSSKQSCYVMYYMLSSGGFTEHAFRSS